MSFGRAFLRRVNNSVKSNLVHDARRFSVEAFPGQSASSLVVLLDPEAFDAGEGRRRRRSRDRSRSPRRNAYPASGESCGAGARPFAGVAGERMFVASGVGAPPSPSKDDRDLEMAKTLQEIQKAPLGTQDGWDAWTRKKSRSAMTVLIRSRAWSSSRVSP